MENSQITVSGSLSEAVPIKLDSVIETVENKDPFNLKVSPKNLEYIRSAVVTIQTDSGHGSGCILTPSGYLVTNYHVIENNDVVTVKLKDLDLQGEVVSRDSLHDLALIKIDGKNHPYLNISMSELSLLDQVRVIGTPQTLKLAQSVSYGIISAEFYRNGIRYIQSDASVNSGNSGGAMVNSKGFLIGIVNAKMKGLGIEGIGFAIPVPYLISIFSKEIEDINSD